MDFYDAWDYAERERKRSRDLEKEQKIARLKRESAATSSKPDSGERSRELEKEQKIARRKREPAATSSKPDSGGRFRESETEEQKIARWKRESAATSSKPDSSDHADDLEVRVVVFSYVESFQILRYYFWCLSFRSYSLVTGTDGPCYLFAEAEYV